MQFATAIDLCARYMDHILTDGTGYYIENPAVLFTQDARDGKYDGIPDDAYSALLDETDELADLWDHQPRRTAGDVLMAGMLTKPKPEKGGPRAALGPVLKKSFEVRTSKDIQDDIAPNVIGQPEAVKTAALIMWHQLSGQRTNAVFCGPSGCGKSEIWRGLAQEYPGLVRMVDFSRFSSEGWNGSLHLRDIFTGTEPAAGSGGTDHHVLLQNNLLKIMDGDVTEFRAKDDQPALSIDCSKVSVVMLGAFERLLDRKVRDAKHVGFGSAPKADAGLHRNITYDDLIRAGMRREIASRVNKIISLAPLSLDDYRAILMGPVLDGVRSSVQRAVRVDDAAVRALAARAIETGLGVRWMRSAILNAMDDAMFDAPEVEAYVITQRDGKLRCRARNPRKSASDCTDCDHAEDYSLLMLGFGTARIAGGG